MPHNDFRLVLDTNVLLRSLINFTSAAGVILDACQRRLLLALLSRPILTEYRRILTDPDIIEKYPLITDERVELVQSWRIS